MRVLLCVVLCVAHASVSQDDRSQEFACLEGEFEWNEGQCRPCLKHDAECENSVECCTTAGMSCWQFGFNLPMCRCDPEFLWNQTSGLCISTDATPITVKANVMWLIVGLLSGFSFVAILTLLLLVFHRKLTNFKQLK